MTKLWGARFSLESDSLADEFNTSLPVDKNLYKEDITASIAHARMLGQTAIISAEDALSIINGLEEIKNDIDKGNLIIADAEDIHMFVEQELTKRIGDAGKKLHTARSRNDQVVTDFKLYVLKSIDEVITELKNIINILIKLSRDNLETYMPGFTHMQKAQPITLAFHLMAYAEMFERDLSRFSEAKKRTSICPLGAGALSGTTHPIDREMTAKELGFSFISDNAMDSVSDRDFVVDYIYNSNMVLMHLSRLSEEIITWASNEYQFIELSDAFSTGSSIMPQKKNPDMAELVRGKAGKMLGNLTSILAILKGLPMAYNKDLQEDKAIFFDTEEILLKSIVITYKTLETSKFNKARMLESAKKGFTNATDVADYLVKKGMPFREAYQVSGKIVSHCIKDNIFIEEMELTALKAFSPLFEEDIYQAIDIKELVAKRNSIGGTSPLMVKKSIENLVLRLKAY